MCLSSTLEKHENLKKAVEKTLDSLNDVEKVAKDVLDLVVSDVLKKFHHKVGVGIEDSVVDLLDDFKQKISTQLIDEIRQWKIPQSNVVIFPRNCRFYYDKGDNVIVVIEEEPKFRNIKLSGELLDSDELYVRKRLPFPYVVYIFHIRMNGLLNSYVSWRSSPLMKTSDKLARPILPNCHFGLEICWGDHRPFGASVAELCEDAISKYWSSEFNEDLSDQWSNRSNISPILGNVSNWANHDVIDMLELDYHNGNDSSVEQKIEQITGNIDEPDIDKIKHNLINIVDKHSEILFSKIIRYFKRTKPERFYPKDVTELLKNNLKECTKDYLDVFYVLQFEYNKLNDHFKHDDRKFVSKSPYWIEE